MWEDGTVAIVWVKQKRGYKLGLEVTFLQSSLIYTIHVSRKKRLRHTASKTSERWRVTKGETNLCQMV